MKSTKPKKSGGGPSWPADLGPVGSVPYALWRLAEAHGAIKNTRVQYLHRVMDYIREVDRDAVWRDSLRAETIRALRHAHVAVWLGRDGQIRIVNGGQPESRAQARAFVHAALQLTGGDICCFCALREGDNRELQRFGQLRSVHPQCINLLNAWRNAADAGASPSIVIEDLQRFGLTSVAPTRSAIQKAYEALVARLQGDSDELPVIAAARDRLMTLESARTS